MLQGPSTPACGSAAEQKVFAECSEPAPMPRVRAASCGTEMSVGEKKSCARGGCKALGGEASPKSMD